MENLRTASHQASCPRWPRSGGEYGSAVRAQHGFHHIIENLRVLILVGRLLESLPGIGKVRAARTTTE